jgi:DNA-directed RNA polymerase specialized sigma24 family protein
VSSATVGHTIAGPTIVLHGREIPADLVAWADRVERRYARRYRDAVGVIEGTAVLGLWTAARTGRDGCDFRSHARHCVIQAIHERLRRAGPQGYRHDQRHPDRRVGAPGVYSLDGSVAAPVARDDPVGWEVDYEDLVEGFARQLPGRFGEVIRLVYLRCDGGSVTRAAGVMGLSHARVSEMHGEAIRMLRRRGWHG